MSNNNDNQQQSLSELILEDEVQENVNSNVKQEVPKPQATNRQVRIKKLDLNTWHGKKGKEDFSRPKTITALVDGVTGKYKTGLTVEEEIHYSKILGTDLGSNFDVNHPHPFWDTAAGRFRLTNGTTVLNLNNPRDYIKFCIARESELVANSQEDFEQGLYPNAVYVMFDEESEIKNELSKIEAEKAANKLAYSLDTASKRTVVRILSEKSVLGKSEDFIEVEIYHLVKTKPREFVQLLSSTTVEDRFMKATILECLDKNILTKAGSVINYMGDQIAMDVDDCVNKLNLPENQMLKIKIIEQLKSK